MHSLQVVRCFEELSDKHILARVIKLILHVVEELCDTYIVVLKELDDVHFLTVLHRLSDVGVLLEELGDGDVVEICVVEHVIGMLVEVVLKELDDGHVYVALVDICVACVVAWVCVVRGGA